MTPADVPAVLERLREQNERDGTSYGLPRIFDARGARLARIPLALVAVEVKTGHVMQAHVWEQTVEQTSYGVSAAATVCSMREQEAVFYLLRERGYRDEHIFVPPQRVAELEPGLEKLLGMTSTGMKHFYRLLDPSANLELRKWYEENTHV